MSLTPQTLRKKLASGTGSADPNEAVVDALDGYIDADEQINYRLPGKGGVVREDNGQTHKTTVPGNETAAAVVTDRKLVFVVASAEQAAQITIPYTDLKAVDAKDGLLRSKLTVEVWGAGEYRLKIADSSELGAAVQYLRESSECWDRVIATLDDVHELAAELGERIEAGDPEAARETREAATAKLEKARAYFDHFEIDSPPALQAEIEAAARERDRTAIRTRIARAETLIAGGTHHTEMREYTQAYRKFWRSRDHLETAQSIAREGTVPEPQELDTKLSTIETRLSHLEVRPRALAQQACERAEGTDKLHVEVGAWQEAFEQYRDALTAGWGTDIDFSGDVDELRSRIETVVATLIERRQDLAGELEREGDEHRRDHPDTACERYDEAIDQLEAALALAREFRSGDPDAIEAERDRLGRKRYDVGE